MSRLPTRLAGVVFAAYYGYRLDAGVESFCNAFFQLFRSHTRAMDRTGLKGIGTNLMGPDTRWMGPCAGCC